MSREDDRRYEAQREAARLDQRRLDAQRETNRLENKRLEWNRLEDRRIANQREDERLDEEQRRKERRDAQQRVYVPPPFPPGAPSSGSAPTSPGSGAAPGRPMTEFERQYAKGEALAKGPLGWLTTFAIFGGIAAVVNWATSTDHGGNKDDPGKKNTPGA